MAKPFRRFKSEGLAMPEAEVPRAGAGKGLRRELPHFNLAPPVAFDPAVFYGGSEADGFVLSLALVYNDLKQIEWTQQIVLGAAEAEVAAGPGQVYGMGIWASRFTFALLHELFGAIKLADSHGVLQCEEFRKCIEPQEIASRWSMLMRFAKGEDLDAAESAALVSYAEMRNRGTYHYGDRGRLLEGYWRFFHDLPKTEFNRRAYLSAGGSPEQTRFYFADAAVASLYDVGDESATTLRDKTGELRLLVSETLALLVTRYIATRQASSRLPRTPIRSASKRPSSRKKG